MCKYEIPYSKIKLRIGTVFSFLFVILSLYMLISTNNENFLNNLFFKVIGIVGILFFGILCGYGTVKLFDNKPGLIIDDFGITDNTNMSSVGLIKWTDIKDIVTMDNSPYLLIYLYDNDKYLNKTNRFKRKLLKGNFYLFKTPISIIANTLDCNFNELAEVIKDKFEKNRK